MKLFSKRYPTWYYSLSDIHKAKGVAIGLSCNTAFKLDKMLRDPMGRFLFLKGSLGSMPCTLANLYAPNRDQAGFLTTTLKKLRDFAQGCVLLAGDFNVPLEPCIDTSKGRSSISHNRLSFIRKQLQDSQLMDVWRIMHPGTKDYTHFSHVHHTYSRLNYFFIDHHHLSLLNNTRIESSPMSDHSPISLELKIPSFPLRATNCKLNESLIIEDIDRKQIADDLALYFKENTHSDITPGILWEAHKAHIRGKLMELGSRKKKRTLILTSSAT